MRVRYISGHSYHCLLNYEVVDHATVRKFGEEMKRIKNIANINNYHIP